MKKTATLKKLSAIILSVVMLLTALGGAITVSADDAGTPNAPTDILLGNTSGRIYQVDYYLAHDPFGKDYIPDYSTLSYSGLKDNNDMWGRFGIGPESTDDPELAYLTDGADEQKVTFSWMTGSQESIEQHRSAIVYDLGGFYNLKTLSIKQDNTATTIYNFSVYAGNTLDDSILGSRVGVGGGTDEIITANLSGANCVRYIVIIFDHISSKDYRRVNVSAYHPDLKQINLYGENPQNILSGNTTGDLYRTSLGKALETNPDFSAIKYSNLTHCNNSNDFNLFATDINDVDGNENVTEMLHKSILGETNTQILSALTTENNARIVKIQDDPGGTYPIEHRVGIAYDLGGYYNLDTFVLTQKLMDGRSLRKFSVYAGNTLDATIFDNRVGNGGSATEEKMAADLSGAKCVRYILVMFDHASVSEEVNMYAYQTYLTAVEVYGTPAEDILLNNTSGRLYQVNYSLPHVPGGPDYIPDYSTLSYSGLTDSNHIYDRYGVDSKNETTDDPELAYLTDGDADQTITIHHAGGGCIPFNEDHRAVIVYDLGGFYNLKTLSIKQDNTGTPIYNFSVYAGNTLDDSILSSRVGVGGGTAETISADLSGADCVRYIAIIFDHVTSKDYKWVNAYAYDPDLKQINLYGEKSHNILSGNTTGDLYRTSLGGVLASDTDFSTIEYDNLTRCNNSNDFNLFATDINDADTDGDITEYLHKSQLGETNTQILSALTTENNTRVVEIRDDQGGTHPIENRVGIAYDLGGNYNLKTLSLTQALTNNEDRKVYNFSVYAGNTLDETIFNNCIGRGGDAAKETVTVQMNGKTSARYILIMFDHMSHDGSVNQHSYYAFLKAIELYGETATEPEEKETVYGDMNGDEKVDILDLVLLKKAIAEVITLDTEIADLDGDGTADSGDLVIITQIILGIDITPPTETLPKSPDLNPDGTDGTDAF